jgi:predicted transcriptional regulator
VRNYVDHDEWFRQEVGRGEAQLDRGEFIDHDKVIAGIERLFES